MASEKNRHAARRKKSLRVRSKIALSRERCRLTVFRSNKNIYAQIIDDSKGVTIACASTLDKDFRKSSGGPFNREVSREVGKRIAARALEKNIVEVVFDRGPYLYHGKVKALADGAREGGLNF